MCMYKYACVYTYMYMYNVRLCKNEYLHVHVGMCIMQDERKGVYVKGLTCREANCEEEALNMLFEVHVHVCNIYCTYTYMYVLHVHMYMYIYM